MNCSVASVAEAFAELKAGLLSSGTVHRTGSDSLVPLSEFIEIRNACITFSNPRRRLGPCGVFVPGQAVARFFWHLFGMSSLESISAYCPNVDRFANEDGEVLGSSYGRKIFRRENGQPSQFEMVSAQMRARPNTKRAFIALLGRSELVEHPMDFACAIGLQMFPRDGVLHMTAFMRANNLTKLFCYNAFEFTMIQEWAAMRHGLELGEYTHSVGSLHSYDIERLRQPSSDNGIVMPPMPPTSDADMDVIAGLESRIRNIETDLSAMRALVRDFGKVHEYWRDLLMALLMVRLERLSNGGAMHELAAYPEFGPVDAMQRALSIKASPAPEKRVAVA